MRTIFKLNFAAQYMIGDIPQFKEHTYKDFISKIIELTEYEVRVVFLFHCNEDVYVTDKALRLLWYIYGQADIQQTKDSVVTASLHLYGSYEEAYEVALQLQEVKELCYAKEKN